ncbi:hypothetical protein SAMN05720615_106165 [Stenotrophomonas indicatrix]|nr:hypothetical protein SAMN05720615_106165 [Stenotrophomonas indicatrix]
MAERLATYQLRESTAAPAPPKENVRVDLHPLCLPKPTVNASACLLEQLFSRFDIASQQPECTRKFVFLVVPTKPRLNPEPLSAQLVQQKRRLSDGSTDIAKLMDLFPQFNNLGRHRQHGWPPFLRVHHVKDLPALSTGHKRLQPSHSFGPLIDGKMQRNCDPLGTSLSVLAAAAMFDKRKTQSNNYSKYSTNRRPRVPPHHTTVLARRPASTKGLPPTHSLIPHRTGQHSATCSAVVEIAHG